ncbi:MAG: hypothetical protein O7F71_14445 [Gammaproteobacteria bacterium]|nr:hypothetical protein [Gammaproteobacteria bacterium]
MMFHRQRLPVRVILLFAALMSFSLTAPVAIAAEAGTCACMCVDGIGEDVCTVSGFIQPTPTPGGCANVCTLQDPPTEDPLTTPPDSTQPPDNSTPDAVVTYDPPVEGAYDCRDRKIWRPDLQKYKVYKVCRKNHRYLAKNDDHDKHRKKRKHKRHDKYDDDDNRKKRKHRRKHHGDDDDDDDDDD